MKQQSYMSDSTTMIEENSNQKQESQDTVVEALANKLLVHMQQKLQTQEGGAHVSGSSISSSISSNANRILGGEGETLYTVATDLEFIY